VTTPLIEYGRRGLCLEDIPVFDAHAHVGNFNDVFAPTLEERLAEMDRIGIDLAAVSSVEGIYGDVRRGNDEVAETVTAHPDRFVGYCHVTAQYPDLMIPELERCFAIPGFRAVKVYQVGTPFDDPLFDPVWEFARVRQAPVLAHTWGGNLTGLDEAAKRFPGVAFFAGHAGSGFAYEAYLDAAGAAPNLYLDLTYSREHTNMIEHFVEQIGASQIVWGTDDPTFSMSHQVGKILFARITDEDKRKILYTTAAELFHLNTEA
jgi:predicted TIM-barrel fold metal-dependent hydrolase